MTTAPNAPGINHVRDDTTTKYNAPKVAVDEATTEQELKQAQPAPVGVLRELALAQWRGLKTQMSSQERPLPPPK